LFDADAALNVYVPSTNHMGEELGVSKAFGAMQELERVPEALGIASKDQWLL